MEQADPSFDILSFGLLGMQGFPAYPLVLGLQLMLNGLFGFFLMV